MYLSDRDLHWAIERNLLIIQVPEGIPPPKIDPTSIDLRLDHVSEAKIWDIEGFKTKHDMAGIGEAELRLGTFKFAAFAEEYLIPPPSYKPHRGAHCCHNLEFARTISRGSGIDHDRSGSCLDEESI